MSTPLISIIIPVYNVEPYLRRCLDSILSQSNGNWEAIVVDDGSTDRSGEICDEYALQDSRIRVIHQGNKGVSNARNTGLGNVTGDWIWFVDADDEIVEGSLDLITNFIINNSCDTIFSGLINVMTDGSEVNDSVSLQVHITKDEFLLNKYAFQNGMILFSREVIECNGLRFNPNVKIGEDLEFQYYYLIWCARPVSIDRCLYKYYRRPGSAMMGGMTLQRRMNDSLTIVSRFADSIIMENISYMPWLSSRLTKMLKAGMQSAALLNKTERKEFINRLRRCKSRLLQAGYGASIDKTIYLACAVPSLYFIMIKNRVK